MKKVLVTRTVIGTVDVPKADVVVGPDEGHATPEALHAFLREHAPIDVAVTMVSDQVDEAFLDAAGGSLKGVVNYAVGYDNIDVGACRERGVTVCNTPHAVTEGTADMAWALLLAAARRIPEADRYARSAAYPERGVLGMAELLGQDIAGRTLLIVGAGRIGYATALRSLGWGMETLYVARSRHFEFEFAPLNARRVELDEGLAQADYLSLHVPLTTETRHLIDARRLSLMKRRAILINTARGPIVDEAALVEALRERRIWAAGLDVYENEPELAPGLADLENVVLSPHIGSGGRRYREMMTDLVSQNARALLAGERPPFVVEK